MALEAVVNGKKKKTARKVGETLRFELDLVLSSDEQSNEFFYPTLLEERTEKQTPSEVTEAGSVVDPFGEDPNEQEKLAAIARSFEEKYGSGPKKKKRKIQDLDLIDKGHGYDLSDSFVDDSEFYEDFVPPQVETVLGGFYINTGQLDFKCRTDLDPEEADFVMKKKKPKLKKNLSHQKILANQKLKKAKQAAFHKSPSKSGKKLLAGQGVSPLVKQTKLKPEKKLKKSKLSLSSSRAKSIALEGSTTASTLAVPIGVGGITVPVFDPATSTLSQVDASSSSVLPTLGPLDANGQGEEQAEKPPPPPKEPPVLPESLLPPDVLVKVKDLEETIRWDQGNGKKLSVKTRSGYDEKLVEIESLCKVVNIKIRNAVFEFLAYKMGVAKGTLTKRMKAVLKKREDDELEEPLRKLKLAVEESMPAQVAEYEEAKRTESLSSASDRPLDVEDETSRMEDVFDDSALVLSGSNHVGGGGASLPGIPLSQEGGAGKVKKTLVRKKYKWNDETKKLLCDVVKIKVESEERISRITRSNGEDTISQFLEEKVRPFWPKGWMQKSVLLKVSEVAHKHFTNPQTKKAVVLKKEKPTTVKKEPVDSKPATLPTLSTLPSATIVSSLISAPSLSQVTTATTSTGAPSTSSRKSIPTDPKELVAFLLKDDNSELLKKVVLSRKLIGEKQGTHVQLASKSHPTSSVIATQSTKLHSTKPVMVAQSAKPHSAVTVGVVQSVGKPRIVSTAAASTVSAIKSLELKSSPPKTISITRTASTTSPSAVQSSVVKTGSSSGLLGHVTHVTVPSPPKVEKKKERKKKLGKDSLSLSATLANTTAAAAVKNSTLKTATNSNPPHMLTSTGILQYIASSGSTSAPLIQVISKAVSGLQPVPPSTGATTAIITTADGRLLLTGASQQQISIAQAGLGSGKLIPSQSSQGTRSGGMEGGISSLLKRGTGIIETVSPKSTVGGAVPSPPRQQHTSLKTTPVIQLPRVSISPSVGSTRSAMNSSTIASVTRGTPPPPLLSTITSTKHPALNEASVLRTQPRQTAVASQPLKQLKLETVSATGQQQEAQDVHKKAAIIVNNNQEAVMKTVTTAPLAQPQTVMPLTGGTTIAQVISQSAPDSFSVSSPPKLVTSSKQVGHPSIQQLPLAGATRSTTVTSVTKDMLPLTITSDSSRVVPETPPQRSTSWKESSPLKSPVEQIMEEHSYLGSSSYGLPQVQPGQSPWQLQLTHTSSPQQQQHSGENVLQTQHVSKGSGAYPKDQ